jgi:hypothetical protein
MHWSSSVILPQSVQNMTFTTLVAGGEKLAGKRRKLP